MEVNNMYKVQVTLSGLTPLRMNKKLEDYEVPDKFKGTKLTREQYIELAQLGAYKDDKGYYVPKNAIKACFVNGGKKVKVGRGAASALLKAILFMNENAYLSKKVKTGIHEEFCRVPPKTGAMVKKFWVTFPEWDLSFTANIIDDRFPISALENSIKEAGLYYGLLDGRPDFGKFVLDSIKKI
jgi:hypothetical protein